MENILCVLSFQSFHSIARFVKPEKVKALWVSAFGVCTMLRHTSPVQPTFAICMELMIWITYDINNHIKVENKIVK